MLVFVFQGTESFCVCMCVIEREKREERAREITSFMISVDAFMSWSECEITALELRASVW